MTIASFIKKSFLLISCTSGALLLLANIVIKYYTVYTTDSIADLPQENACLVLGTSKYRLDGSPSLFFSNRMSAAFDVYTAGKCKIIIVSGNGLEPNYNEPNDMKKNLMAKGVPDSAIVCDYAGGRTLDSVVRFKTAFGQVSGIVISQQFHNERAIFLASHNDVKLTGYNAQDVAFSDSLRTLLREVLARLLAVLDVTIFQSEPKFYGET